MAKKKSFQSIMDAFKKKYGNRFDYSLINEKDYKNQSTKLPIICPKHGLFYMYPGRHLSSICGCPMCGNELKGSKLRGQRKQRKLIFGIGVNDDPLIHSKRLKNDDNDAYIKWHTMLARCYSKSYQSKQNAYKGCSVCEEWLTYSNFKKWHDENYIDGYELDKDILVKGNKVYSPSTCCYVPKFINSLFLSCGKVRGRLPIGVIAHKTKNGENYVAQMSNYPNGKRYGYIGIYNTPEEAFEAYKKAKEARIIEIANEYYQKGLIKENVYAALISRKIDIND